MNCSAVKAVFGNSLLILVDDDTTWNQATYMYVTLLSPELGSHKTISFLCRKIRDRIDLRSALDLFKSLVHYCII